MLVSIARIDRNVEVVEKALAVQIQNLNLKEMSLTLLMGKNRKTVFLMPLRHYC